MDEENLDTFKIRRTQKLKSIKKLILNRIFNF